MDKKPIFVKSLSIKKMKVFSHINRRSVISIILMVMGCFFSECAYGAERGEKSIGLRGGYTTSNKSAVAGLYFQYAFSSKFRLAPDIMYTFRNNGTDAYSINMNAQIPFSLKDNRFALYPLAGINYTSWNKLKEDYEGHDDAKSRFDRLGLNIGGGIEYYVKPTLKLSFEAKYRALKDYGSGVFTMSIGYVF
ncbi:MAG: porin family protein [Paramuribaculum sp.]|nr:porin family protein [Paramuribaculum sp.]